MYAPSHSETEVSTHEVRFTTDQDKSVRLTGGAFFSDTTLQERVSFTYPGSIKAQGCDCLPLVLASLETTCLIRMVIFLLMCLSRRVKFSVTMFQRTDEQYGIFGELSYDISDELSVTLGATVLRHRS